MVENELLWKERYRDLENQLEAIMLRVAEAMVELTKERSNASLNKAKDLYTQHIPPSIRTISKLPDKEMTLCCVADGINMEFSLKVKHKGSVVEEIPYQRSNTFNLNHLANGQYTAVFSVRSNGQANLIASVVREYNL